MRRFSPFMRHRSTGVRLLLGAALAAALAITTIQAQIPGRNVNMVSGLRLPDGDPYLQRQNEPSIAASTRNPLHLLGGSNDYRTVDVPGLPNGEETGDAWLGLFKSTDGGQRWTSGLLPGYPQDQSPAGLASPLRAKPTVPGSGYQAGADAVVRAGTNGLIYYSGLVFDRAENGKSGVFLARFIDNNNQEAGDPVAYLGTTMVAQSNGAKFLDKPWMAVDIPRSNSAFCTVTADNILPTSQNGRRRRNGYDRHERSNRGNGRNRGNGGATAPGTQRIPAGAVYVAYSSITGDATTLRSEILLTRSMDCGNTWSAPIKVSRPEDAINQGSSLTIDPRTGAVYVSWRRFDPDLVDNHDLDAIMVARLPLGATRVDAPSRAHKFPKPTRKVGRKLHKLFEHRDNRFKDVPVNEATDTLDQFDLGTTGFNFRTNAYPTMAADGSGRVYMAWTQRGFAADSGTGDGARIVIATTRDGRTFTTPQAVDDHVDPGRGHQLMPSMAFAGGRLMVVFYDLRDTKARGTSVHDRIVSDGNKSTRHTIDIRAAMAAPGDHPDFGADGSVKVSDYLMGFNPYSRKVEEMQVNPPNLPMFKQGTVPFIGDYIDVTAAPAFVPGKNGKWAYNTASSGAEPVFHAAWTDNRDVRPPLDGNWANYTPAPIRMSDEQLRGQSQSDPSQTVLQCDPNNPSSGNLGSRNQNVYSARITGGLLAGSPGNAKRLGYKLDANGQPTPDLMQRGFVVFAQNTTLETKSFRMTILNQPPGGLASFEQFPAAVPDTAIEMIVPARSTASRTVYVTSTDPKARVDVDVSELVDLRTLDLLAYPSAPEKTAGLEARVLLNPDIENPDIENPDIENTGVLNPDIENVEVYNPDIENPDIENPDIENPDIENPDIENPDIENPDIENPDIENVRVANPDIENLTVANPDIENPDIENPDIENPDIENPDIENPDIENGALADVTWKVTNTGNTTASFNVNVFLAQQSLPQSLTTRLFLLKTYRTPTTLRGSCTLGFETRNILLANIPNPRFIPPAGGGAPDQNDPAETNATLWLAPGEEGRIVLRVFDENVADNVPVVKPDGTTEFVDPAFAPTGGTTPSVSSQGVNTDAPVGQTDPPLVTPTGANLFFLQMPSNSAAGSPIAPEVRVQVRDNLTGTPVPGATVALSLGSNPSSATLANFIAVTGSVAAVDLGIATFPALSVSTNGTGYTLVATATTGGVTAQAVSTPFDVGCAAPLVVSNTNDSGCGSLRSAMTYANATAGVQTITFAIPGGPAVIEPASALPPITDSVVINGFPQVLEHDGLPVVEVRGQAAWTGFYLDASRITIRGLAITQFGQAVFAMQVHTEHVLEQNYIGTNRFNEDRGNNFGVVWRASSSAIRDNVISGNTEDGLSLVMGASSNTVSGNRIGVGGDGAALPNGHNGVTLNDAANSNILDGNLISGNGGVGVDIQKNTLVDVSGTRFRNNTIGLDEGGQAMANRGGGIRIDSAPDTVIGEPGAGNTISGNQVPPVAEVGSYTGGPGITVLGWTGVENRPVIQANRIGTDPTGNEARPNMYEGIVLYGPALVGGSSLEGRGNLIAGNGAGNQGTGVAILYAGATGSVIQGNTIGLAANGSALGNGYSGITVYGAAQNALIGGDALGEANTISGNPAAGIAIYGDGNATPQRIAIAGNAIYGNVGAGISLAPGANNSQPFPVVSNATNIGSDTMASFNLAGFAPSIYTLRFFASSSCELSGYGEGEVFVGKTTVDSGVSSTGSILLPLQSAGRVITATATDALGNTSEFSACAVVTAGGPPPPPQGAEVTISNFDHIFNGEAKPATVVTNPANLAVSVTYNGSSTVPSAIGAYTVAATVTAPGYAGIAYVNQTIASTNRAGGAGGAPFGSFCAPGVFANGVSPSTNGAYGLYGGQLLCSTPANPPAFIGQLSYITSYTSTDVTCGAGEVMVGLHGQTSTSAGFLVVATMGPRCQPAVGGDITEVAAVGTYTGSQAFSLTCPAGQAVTGVVGGVGEVVDSIALVCAPPPPPVTVVGPMGGIGGSPFAYSCPAGTTATGFRVRTPETYALTAAELICSDESSTPTFGGTTVPDTALTCAVGDRMVGMVGSHSFAAGVGGAVGGIAPRCQNTGGGIAPATGGSPNSGSLTFDCPADTVVLGVQGREGDVLDQLSLVCGPRPIQ